MPRSALLQLMGLTPHGNDSNYGTLSANWDETEQHLRIHPEEAFQCDDMNNVNTQSNCGFYPLYIALRNEVTPVPSTIINLLLLHVGTHNDNNNNMTTTEEQYPMLGDETLDVALRNPHTSGDVMKLLLDAQPDYCKLKWYTPLHYAAKRGRSVEAVKVLLERYTTTATITAAEGTEADNDNNDLENREGTISLSDIRDSYQRTPLHEACAEGSPDILRLFLIEEQKRIMKYNQNNSSITNQQEEEENDDENEDQNNGLDESRTSTTKREEEEGPLFQKDLLGFTPFACAVLQMTHLEDCYTNGLSKKKKYHSVRFYNGKGFHKKRRDSWRRLVLCVQAGMLQLNEIKKKNYWDNMMNTNKTEASYTDEVNSFFCTTTEQVSNCLDEVQFLIAAIELSTYSTTTTMGHTSSSSQLLGTHSALEANNLLHLLLQTGHCDKRTIASTRDKASGLLPFHLAEKRGLTTSTGLLWILEAYPEAIFGKDTLHHGIIPQLITVLGENFGLEAIYTMVTNAPSFFDSHGNKRYQSTTINGEVNNVKRSSEQQEYSDDVGRNKKQKA